MALSDKNASQALPPPPSPATQAIFDMILTTVAKETVRFLADG
jgi:hypothetical protein